MATTTNIQMPLLEVGTLAPETVVNTALAYADACLWGYLSKSVAGSANVTLTETEARNMVIELTGLLTGNIQVKLPQRENNHVIFNNTTGAFTVTLVPVTSGTGVAVTQGSGSLIYYNGTNIAGFPLSASTGAPASAQYLTLATDATLTVERVLTAGANLLLTDAGAGSTLTVDAMTQNIAFAGDISPAQITADQNDYNPTGLSTASTLRLNTDASRTLTGLAGGADGRIIIVHNIGSFALVLADENASSTAGNRFALTANTTLSTDDSCILRYDSTTARWRLIASSSGGTSGGAADKIAYWTSSSTLSNDTSLHWDALNDALGIIATAGGTSGVGLIALGLGTVPTSGPADTAQLYAVDESAGKAGLGVTAEGNIKHLLATQVVLGSQTPSANALGGLVVDQRTNNDGVLQFRKTGGNIAHGMTGIVATDIYTDMRPITSSEGGLQLRSLTEATLAMILSGLYTTSITTLAASTDAPVMVEVGKKSGASVGDTDADDVLFGIAGRFGANPTVWLANRAGKTWQPGPAIFLREIEANTAGSGSPNVLVGSTETLKVLTNEGATARNYHTLPSAAAGYQFTFISQDADLMRVTAATGDTIRVTLGVTATGGFIENTAQGDCITLVAINATEWIDIASRGTWTPT